MLKTGAVSRMKSFQNWPGSSSTSGAGASRIRRSSKPFSSSRVPANDCVGIGDVLRRRGHRVVFVAEESFAGTLEAKGFEERLMRLSAAPEMPEQPGQFWKDFIRDTAPVFRADPGAARRVHPPDVAGAHRRRPLR